MTIDAIGCQRDIAENLGQEADYVLALKAIRAHCAKMSSYSQSSRSNGFKDTKISRHERSTVITAGSTRTYTVIQDVAWLQDATTGRDCKASSWSRAHANRRQDRRETRFYITSLVWLASQLGPVIRAIGRWRTACTG